MQLIKYDNKYNENSYDKQISSLNEENKKQAQEIVDLEKKNAKLQKQIDEGSVQKEDTSKKDADN